MKIFHKDYVGMMELRLTDKLSTYKTDELMHNLSGVIISTKMNLWVLEMKQ